MSLIIVFIIIIINTRTDWDRYVDFSQTKKITQRFQGEMILF